MKSTPSIGPIDISISIPSDKSFKSLNSNLKWSQIPPFAVLTGRNGAGKSQFLQMLAHRLSGTLHPRERDISHIKLSLVGDKFEPDDIVYVADSGDIAGSVSIDFSSMQQTKKSLYNNLAKNDPSGDMRRSSQKRRLEKLLGVERLNSLTEAEFIARVPDDYSYMLEDYDVIRGLGHVFLAYRVQMAERREKGLSVEEIGKELGSPPWDVLNDTLALADFPYRVRSPLESKFLEQYHLRLQDTGSGQEIQPEDLSSGEKVVLRLVLWLYNSNQFNRFPRLFLLDEPDAHLHPSMARQFMAVIREVLVDKFNVRVIMSTHSPSTVALAPDDSVFEMTRGAPSILPSPTKAHAIGLLTSGLVVVSPTTRLVLVEDQLDVLFYETVRDILTDHGPSRDALALNPEPSIAFLPASYGVKAAKVAGGRDAVIRWVDKLDAEPFDQLVLGIIDKDSSNSAAKRVHLLGRYSIENYLLDPFVLFGLLVELGKSPNLPGISVTSGDEHQIRSLSETQLQTVVDYFGTVIEPALAKSGQPKTPVSVTYTNGSTVQFPEWMISYRGHDLFAAVQSKLGGPSVVTPPRLLKSMKRVRMIALDLALLMRAVQRSGHS